MKFSFILFFGVVSFSVFATEKGAKSFRERKVLPSYLQKAYVLQKDAIVYARPDFDSSQIIAIPAGTKITISKKIHRPNHRFGTFYRIYISKPKKLRAYISEIDVVPRYVKSGSHFKLNPEFDQVKKKLKYVKDFQLNRDHEGLIDIGDKPLSEIKFIGLTVSYSWMAYQDKEKAIPTWFFGLKLSGADLPINGIITDTSLMLSLSPPVIDKKQLKNGYIVLGDFLFKLPVLDAPYFLFHLGLGALVKLQGALAPEKTSSFEVGAGVVSSASLTLKIHDRLSFLIEGKGYYDMLENEFVPSILAGLMVAF